MPGTSKDDGGFDLGDLVEKAGDLIGDHTDEVKDGLDTAADFVGDKLGVDKKTMKSVKDTAHGVVDDLGGDDANAKKKPARKSTKK
jgi:hypothetical protein